MPADLISAYMFESERRFDGAVPDALFEAQIADVFYPDPRFRKLEMRVLPKERAYECVKEHHSALGGEAKIPPGTMYAVGAYRRKAPTKLPELVAVALAGHPTGRYGKSMPGRPAPCSVYGVLNLTRVASIAGLYTTNRKGKRVPLNASSMLTSRMMDLLPESGRKGQPGCLFVTHSLVSEAGTTYLSLVSKGLRPVGRVKGKAQTGTRAGGKGTALSDIDKVTWEYGPAALPPDWSALEGVVSPAKIERAAARFPGKIQVQRLLFANRRRRRGQS